MFKNQPKIDVKPTSKDRKIILIGWVLVAINLILAFVFYFKLPDTIPIHFNLKGEADGFGSKSNIWTIPILNLVMYYGMTLLTTKMKPWHYNYPVRVTEKNAPKLYAMAIEMMVWINFGIALLFLIVTVEMISKAMKFGFTTYGWVIIATLALSVLLPFWYIYKMFKLSKK